MIYLVGGTTGSGKSVFGRLVAERFGIRHVEVDQIRMAEQARSRPGHPLRYFVDRPANEYLSEPVEDLCVRQYVVAMLTSVALASEVEASRRSQEDVLFEGDDVLPAFAAALNDRSNLRAMFAVEDDPSMPLARTARRVGGISQAQAETFLAVHRCHGRRIAHEARLLGLPIVSPRDHSSWLSALGLASQ